MDRPSRGGRSSSCDAVAAALGELSQHTSGNKAAPERECGDEAQVVLPVEGAQFEAGLRGRLLVTRTCDEQAVEIGSGHRDEAGELKLGVTSDELRLALQDSGLCPAVAGT